jgi:hypothetical protein
MLGTTKGSKNAKSAVHRNQVITEYLLHMLYANRIQDNPSQATFLSASSIFFCKN